MNILTLNTEAYGGGASQIALSLMDFYRTAGHDSWMLNAVHNDTKDKLGSYKTMMPAILCSV